jgi:hypothetical protein
MKRLISPFTLGLSTAVLCLLVGIGMLGVHVFAIDNVGPDPREYGGSNAYYELSNTVDVVSTSMAVPIYWPYKPNVNIPVFVTYGSGGGVLSFEGAAAGTPGSFQMVPAKFTFDAGSGYYRAVIDVQLPGGVSANNYRAFKLSVPDPGLIGYSASNSSRFAIANLNRCDVRGDTSGCDIYRNYNLAFAGECSVGSSRQSIDIFDADNPAGPTKYNIQPNRFGYKLIDTTTGANIATTFSGGFGNNQNANLAFNYTKGHKYELQLNGVYSNNVIQFHLPFDSIYATVPCMTGAVTTSAVASCTTIRGYIYNYVTPAAGMQYFIYVNPPAGTAVTFPSQSKAPAITAGFRGPGNANLPNPPGTPAGVPANHGFSLAVPANVSQYNYNGDYAANDYWVYARQNGTATITRVAAIAVPPCGKLVCGGTDFSAKVLNQNVPFQVSADMVSSAAPPPGSRFNISVLKDGAPVYVDNNISYTQSGTTFTSNPTQNYTPTSPGSYQLLWWFGSPATRTPFCSSAVSVPGYAPFFSVQGGDIAAGVGYGAGCAEPVADIAAWNNNTSAAPNYFGAGSEVGATATGTITNFVSGLGLSGGVAAQAGHGLSFANTVATGVAQYGGQYGASIECMPDYYGTNTTSAPTTIPQWHLNQGNFFGAKNGFFTANPGGGMNTVELGEGASNPAKNLIIPAGNTITLYVSGDVYIDSNILYAPYNTNNVPRFNLYVQGNIYIDPNVTELHGVYMAQVKAGVPASGKITTCASNTMTTVQTYSDCSQLLTVVGAMGAGGQLRLNRTQGSLAADVPNGVPAAPAEIFQYSPELWMSGSPDTGLNVQTYTSLPPVL